MLSKLLYGIIAQLSAYASLLGLYFTLVPFGSPRPSWHWVAISLILVFAIYSLFVSSAEYFKVVEKKYKRSQDINNYMCRWLSSGGRALIFSRDLSWADDKHVKQVLLKKAASRELKIILEHEVPISKELERAGATLIYYKGSGCVPSSRFTIIDHEKDGARIAIGVRRDGVQVIQEFQRGKDPLFAVAEDLAKFISAYSGSASNDSKSQK